MRLHYSSDMRGSKRAAFVEKPESFGLRFVGYADEICGRSIGHTGWYCDDSQYEKYRGAVFQIPGRKGESRFIAGYQESYNGGYVIDFETVFREPRGDYADATDLDAARDAARAADQFAEWNAEDAREYDTAWQAGGRWRDLGEEIADERREALTLLKERRAVRGLADTAPSICQRLKSDIESIIERIAELRAERESLAAGEYGELPFWTGDKILRDAFNNGAGYAILR